MGSALAGAATGPVAALIAAAIALALFAMGRRVAAAGAVAMSLLLALRFALTRLALLRALLVTALALGLRREGCRGRVADQRLRIDNLERTARQTFDQLEI